MHMQWGHTAIYSASVEGHSEVVKQLVQAGADLELQRKVYIGEIHASTYILCVTIINYSASLNLMHKYMRSYNSMTMSSVMCRRVRILH